MKRAYRSTRHEAIRPARRLVRVLACLLALLPAAGAYAQVNPGPAVQPVTLTLDEAIQIALVNNYALRSTRLDVDNAGAQVREAWGQVMPQVDVFADYTRNIKSANPFAGSQAGGLFQSLGFIDWLAYNEQARTDDDPSSAPISLDEFFERRQAGLDAAGIVLDDGGNPFAVPNQFTNGVSVSQTLFSGSAFAAIRGAERLRRINERTVDRQEQLLIDEVRQAYYTALLASQQADVVAQSVARTRQTVLDMTRRVAQGTAPKFERLSAEVEQANLEAQLVQAQNQATLALDNLKLTLGIPVEQPVRLRGELDVDDPGAFLTISEEDAVSIALERRPDVEQHRIAVELRRIDRDITRSQYLPTVTAFANFNYIGNVPDNRTFTVSDPDDPFKFTSRSNGFFSQAYWNPSINAGLSVRWNLFNGFQTSAQVQQRQIAVDKAQIAYDQQVQVVRLEVQQALRNLESARQRILSTQQNIARAELNYEYATARLREGVASQLEERNASEQLDQSRLNYLQAVHDYLVARSAFQTAIGMPLAKPSALRLTSK